jgi:hypothetical protein
MHAAARAAGRRSVGVIRRASVVFCDSQQVHADIPIGQRGDQATGGADVLAQMGADNDDVAAPPEAQRE